MYTLLREVKVRTVWRREAVSLLAALLMVETLFKLHSFLLEAGVFLGIWYAISALAARLLGNTSRSAAA